MVGVNDLASLFPILAAEWHPTKNSSGPETVTAGSHRVAWWRHEVDGSSHEWTAPVQDRTINGYGCPGCSGKRVLVGVNDLAFLAPPFAAEWHPTKNSFGPEAVTIGSKKKVWWRHEIGGVEHDWIATVNNRSSGQGCAICKSRQVMAGVNDLASRFPAIAAEWHPTKNPFGPEQASAYSFKMVWWRHEIGGVTHEWAMTIANRSAGHTCAVCAGRQVMVGVNDLASQAPALAAEWHPTKNSFGPETVTIASTKRVLWRHEVDGIAHEWVATIASRGRPSGCPVCAGQLVMVGVNDLASQAPALAAEWHPTKNSFGPETVTTGTWTRVWWFHEVDGVAHEWATAIGNRSNGSDCPTCCKTQTSKIEKALFDALSPHLSDALHNTPIPLTWGARNTVARPDIAGTFAARPVVVEYDGAHWHSTPSNISRDINKTLALLDVGFLVVRVRAGDLGRLDLSRVGLLQIEIPKPGLSAARHEAALVPVVTEILSWLEQRTR